MSTATTRSMDELRASAAAQTTARPKPPPPRRNLSQYPAAAASYASNRLSGAWNDYSEFEEVLPVLSKKEELWKRRWSKAKSVMDKEGVVLRTWRVGSDVMDVCVEAVNQELREMEKKDRKDLEKDKAKNGGNGGNKQGTLI